jgi:peptide/nickel transport system permease protein
MGYLLRRVLQLVPAVWCILTLTFVLIHLAPGGPLVALSGDFSTAEYQREVAAIYGLDRPLIEQYATYMTHVLGGDLGHSYFFRRPVAAVLLERLPATLLLMLPAIALSSGLGIAIGLASTPARTPRANVGLVVIALGAYAVPTFWLAQLLVLLFAVELDWLPAQGFSDLRAAHSGLALWLDVVRHLALPVVALAINSLAVTALVAAARLRNEVAQPYFQTALAKGLSFAAARRGHALRNTMVPIVTVIGGRVGFVCAGAVLVENVFGWPGLGRLIVAASENRDYPLVLGLFLFISVFTLVANLVTDALYGLIDPRIRQGRANDA